MAVEEAQFASTNLESARYDSETRELEITFARTGDSYAYHGVPPDVWQQLQQAFSPGQFFAREIKGRYE